MDISAEEPTIQVPRLRIVTPPRDVQPIIVLPGRRPRPGELGWARLARQPQRRERYVPRGWRFMVRRLLSRYWLWWGLGVVGLTALMMAAAGLYALAVTVR